MSRFDIYKSVNDCAVYDYDKVASFNIEEEAVSYCEEHNWEMEKDGIWYDLIISDSLEE